MQMVFQHTAARRRLLAKLQEELALKTVSTHSRPKAAAADYEAALKSQVVSTHSRPKAAAYISCYSLIILRKVSTHSRPKAAA